MGRFGARLHDARQPPSSGAVTTCGATAWAGPGPSAHAKTDRRTAGPADYNRICALRLGLARGGRSTLALNPHSAACAVGAVPLGIVATHGFAAGLQRMTAVELKRLLTMVLVVPAKSGEGLNGRGRQTE